MSIRGGGARRDWNGIHYKQGMSAKNAGTTKLSANIATIAPDGVAYALRLHPQSHLHFHCVVIDGVFDATAAGGVVFHAADGLDAQALAAVQACAQRRLLRLFVRRGLLPGDDAQAMGQWDHGGGFSVTARCASRALTALGASAAALLRPAAVRLGPATRT